MHSFLLAFAVGIGIICALAGWGWLVVNALRIRVSTGIGFCAAIGLALSTSFGGLLDGLHLITPSIVRVYLVAGLLLAVFAGVRHLGSARAGWVSAWAYFRREKLMALLAAILLFVTVVKYATAVSPGLFHLQDDYHAYMAFPVKMLQTGSIGADPFSERRIVSSLGGEAFLDTLTLSVTGQVKNLHLTDGGIGFIILLLLLAEIMIRKRLPGLCILLTLLAASMYAAPISNLTAVYCGIALLILLFDYFDREVEHPAWNQVGFLAIVFASLMSMKTTFAPMAGIFFLSFFLYQLVRLPEKGKTVARAVLCGLAIIILLVPWMIDSYHSSGTYFYPLQGKGFHGSRYGIYLLPTANIGLHNLLAFFDGFANAVGALLATIVCLVLLGGRRNRSQHNWMVETVIIINLLIDVVFIGIGVGGVQTFRYSFAILFACALFLLIEELAVFTKPTDSAATGSSASLSLAPASIAAVLLLGMLLGSGWDTFMLAEKDFELSALRFSLSGKNIVSPAEVSAYGEMQSSIPAGEKVLVRLDKNFLLNFRRNTIFIDDLPGGASLPPGVPIFKGPEALAGYLLQHGIRYVAYSYGDEATFSRTLFSDRLQPGVNVWLRRGAQIAFDFQDNLLLLGRTRKKLFDDGEMFVLDLASPAQTTSGVAAAN